LSNINSKELKFGLILIGQKKRRRHFTPFIATTDGMLGKEAKNFVAKLVDRRIPSNTTKHQHHRPQRTPLHRRNNPSLNQTKTTTNHNEIKKIQERHC